jgi:hypothetical protein
MTAIEDARAALASWVNMDEPTYPELSRNGWALYEALRALTAPPTDDERECRDCGRTDGGCDRVVQGDAKLLQNSDDEREAQRAGTWCPECGGLEVARVMSIAVGCPSCETAGPVSETRRPITDAQVEAAAKALAESFGEEPHLPWDGWGELSQDEFRRDARTALEAARDA